MKYPKNFVVVEEAETGATLVIHEEVAKEFGFKVGDLPVSSATIAEMRDKEAKWQKSNKAILPGKGEIVVVAG